MLVEGADPDPDPVLSVEDVPAGGSYPELARAGDPADWLGLSAVWGGAWGPAMLLGAGGEPLLAGA